MRFMPDPLHPAIVHFPVVLILLGMVVAVGAIFWRRHYLPLLAGVLLGLGALGAWVAVETGESAGGLVETDFNQAKALLDAHQDWAERTLVAAVAAAVLSGISIGLFRYPRLARAVAVVAAAAALTAGYAVYETGHRGGALVFRHGVGVDAAAAASVPERGGGDARHFAEDRDRDGD